MLAVYEFITPQTYVLFRQELQDDILPVNCDETDAEERGESARVDKETGYVTHHLGNRVSLLSQVISFFPICPKR